ncbi:MAG: glycosyltransferase family 2 protein [Candidatus Sumerlaeia bacterium]
MWLHVMFWISAGILVFTFAGYPLALVLMCPFRRRPAIPKEASFEPFISLIVPARNEEQHILRKLQNCVELDYPAHKMEILIVDDASEDRTASIISDFLNDFKSQGGDISRFRVLRQETNKGKVAALNRAVAEAKGEVVVFSDADSLISKHSLRLLLHPFINPIVACVAGRYFPGGVSGRNAAGVGFYWKYENYLRRKESQAGGLLGASGALYAIRRSEYEPLNEGAINDDFIIPMRMTEKGFRCLYEPRATAVEDESRNSQIEYSRRVRIMAGNCEHLWMFRGLLMSRRKWRTALQLFCHKFLRVVSPIFLILFFFSNTLLLFGLLPSDGNSSGAIGPYVGYGLLLPFFYLIMFILQCLFYSLALFGYSRKGEDQVSKLMTLPYYFCMVNLSSLHGIYYFIFNRSQLPWTSAARSRVDEDENDNLHDSVLAARGHKS